MTAGQIIACAIAWTAAAVALWSLLGVHRAGRRLRLRQRTFPVGGGVVTFPTRMSEAEVEAFKARWQEAHGKPGTAHQVTDVSEEQQS